MKTIINKAVLAAIAGVILASAAQAQTVTTFVGGNATQKIIQDRVPTILSGATLQVNATNSNIFSYTGGTLGGNAVTWNFNLTGGAGAIVDLTVTPPTPVVIYNNSTATPTAAISITGPNTIGINPSSFTELPTLASPIVFAKNASLPNSLGGITNLTSRQAAFLEAFSGLNPVTGVTLTTSALGGSSTSDPIYFVGRNNIAAVRQVTDANIYYNTLIDSATYPVVNWTTNGSGVPITWAGAANGAGVAGILNVISNSIGTLAIGDVTASLTTLSYEGVPFSVTNVLNGSYPIWGVERYLYLTSGTYAPSASQLTAINALVSAVTDATFESTSSLFVGKYVSLQALNSAGTYRDLDTDGAVIQRAPDVFGSY